jgi:hypothetical protein
MVGPPGPRRRVHERTVEVHLEKLGLRALREAEDNVALAVPLIVVMAGAKGETTAEPVDNRVIATADEVCRERDLMWPLAVDLYFRHLTLAIDHRFTPPLTRAYCPQ